MRVQRVQWVVETVPTGVMVLTKRIADGNDAAWTVVVLLKVVHMALHSADMLTTCYLLAI